MICSDSSHHEIALFAYHKYKIHREDFALGRHDDSLEFQQLYYYPNIFIRDLLVDYLTTSYHRMKTSNYRMCWLLLQIAERYILNPRKIEEYWKKLFLQNNIDIFLFDIINITQFRTSLKDRSLSYQNVFFRWNYLHKAIPSNSNFRQKNIATINSTKW